LQIFCVPAMTALGHKRTCAVRKGMFALPLKADIAPSFLNRRHRIGMKAAHAIGQHFATSTYMPST